VQHPVTQRPVAILAYGSLLYRPGPQLAAVIVRRVPCTTPFPVEYARASGRWGGGPVLTPHPDGGRVEGQLLVLADTVQLGAAIDMLATREGLPDARGVVEVAGADPRAERMVLTAALPRNLPAPDMRPESLAVRAVASAAGGPRNGIAYLRGAIESGIDTPLTGAYAAAVLALTGAADLTEAERLVA
jgi:cation transport regulator ChaC